MTFHIIIPARFASTRLPGKPLRKIMGKTMIERVYDNAKLSQALSITVATDDARIFEAVEQFGGQVVMTDKHHESGTDRLQDAAQQLGLLGSDIVVNVQGDEPLIPANVIDQVALNLTENALASVATLYEGIVNVEDVFDPNIVKVVLNELGFALYFSRAPIPWNRQNFSSESAKKTLLVDSTKRHIGIYAYRVSLLNEFVTWPMASLEAIEKLEQLRILSNGYRIHAALACAAVPGGIDTQEDLDRVTKLFADISANV